MFMPYTQEVWPSMALMHIVLRTKADPVTAIGAARQIIHDLDAGIPLADVSTLTDITKRSMATNRFSMLVVGFFGVLRWSSPLSAFTESSRTPRINEHARLQSALRWEPSAVMCSAWCSAKDCASPRWAFFSVYSQHCWLAAC
jgi:hypothetical protein